MSGVLGERPKKISVLVVGDAPNTPTGLSRIARDLISGLIRDQELLGIQVYQLGLNYDGSLQPWFVFPVFDSDNWGMKDLMEAYEQIPKPVVVFTIWDPGRCLGLWQGAIQMAIDSPDPLEMDLWGYFPVDAYGPTEDRLTGPVEETLRGYDRVLGYGEWGASILKRTLGEGGKSVQWLPHGMDMRVWWEDSPPMIESHGVRIGAVMANQARKDFGLVFATAAELRKAYPDLQLWIHTDHLVKHWSIPQLAIDFGFNNPSLIVTLPPMSDEIMAANYKACTVTLAPGLGEGFGYPIVESLACGVPVIHGSYGGGASLIPQRLWLVNPGAYRLDGAYNLVRPVYKSIDFAHAAARAIDWKRSDPQLVEAYCKRSVSYLDWQYLWPRWRTWFKLGLNEIRERREREA